MITLFVTLVRFVRYHEIPDEYDDLARYCFYVLITFFILFWIYHSIQEKRKKS